MSNYEKSNASVNEQVLGVMTLYHGALVDAGVTVCVLMAHAKTDENGDTTGPALMHQGYPCAGLCKIVSAKDRAKGCADVDLTFDGDRWEEWSIAEQTALIDHELTHLELSIDDEGLVKRDDLSRPKLRMRKHDHQFGWFDIIAKRHGEASFEVKQARAFHDDAGQYYFDFAAAS